MSNDYNGLDIDHKRELLMNQAALYLAINNLAIELKCYLAEVSSEIWQLSYDRVMELSIDQVHQQIYDLEVTHRPFSEPGMVSIQDLGNTTNQP
jgi:hypothetical protein